MSVEEIAKDKVVKYHQHDHTSTDHRVTLVPLAKPYSLRVSCLVVEVGRTSYATTRTTVISQTIFATSDALRTRRTHRIH